MTVESVSLFCALLAVVAELAVATGVSLAVGGRMSTLVAEVGSSVKDAVAPAALGLAAAVALVATSGSLWFSEVANFTPCRLCWYQRICMYPLVPMLGIAALRRDAHVRIYAAVLAATGLVISTYHVVLERFPTLESGVCEAANPCTLIWVQRFGYLTIPTMALSGFALILTLLAVADPAGDDR
jgi:disulfide bond formation protein DsbB